MKNNTRNKVNLIFSSFLVIGYIVCTYFFSTLAGQVAGFVGGLIRTLILVLFGLLLFYATRVGDGKQIKRFSVAVLLMIVVPCLYIVAANFIEGLPLHEYFASATTVLATGATVSSQPVIVMLAAIALGYGVPYTFLSGYETDPGEDEAAAPAEEEAVLEGGLAEELLGAEAEAEAAQTEAIIKDVFSVPDDDEDTDEDTGEE